MSFTLCALPDVMRISKTLFVELSNCRIVEFLVDSLEFLYHRQIDKQNLFSGLWKYQLVGIIFKKEHALNSRMPNILYLCTRIINVSLLIKQSNGIFIFIRISFGRTSRQSG